MALFTFTDVSYCEDTDCGTGKLTQFDGCQLNADLEGINPALKAGSRWAIIVTELRGVGFEESSRILFYAELESTPVEVPVTHMLNPTRRAGYTNGKDHLKELTAQIIES